MEEGRRACDSSSKSRGKGEESVDGCQFATVHEEAPQPTRPFRNCTKGLADVSLTCWNGTTCQRNMVCNFSCKMRSGRVGPRCRISYRPFFNGVPFSFEARLTSTVCRENINYPTTTPPLVLVSKKIYRLELQRLLAKVYPLAFHTITLSPDLKKTASLPLLNGGLRSAGEEKDVQR